MLKRRIFFPLIIIILVTSLGIAKGEFEHNKNIHVDNNLEINLTEYPVKIILNDNNFSFTEAETDGSDIRFYDGETKLGYYLESWDAVEEEATIWVKVDVPVEGTDITFYYGDEGASSESDIEDVYEVYDYFGDGKSSVWSTVGGFYYTTSAGHMWMNAPTNLVGWTPITEGLFATFENDVGIYVQISSLYLYDVTADEMYQGFIYLRDAEGGTIGSAGFSDGLSAQSVRGISASIGSSTYSSTGASGAYNWRFIIDEDGNGELYSGETLSKSDTGLDNVEMVQVYAARYFDFPTPSDYRVQQGLGVSSILVRKYVSIEPTAFIGNRVPTVEDAYLECYYLVEYSDVVNASDLDGDTLSFELLETTARGDLDFDTETGEFTYTAVNGYAVEDSFTFRAYDGEDYSETGEITLFIINPEVPDCGDEVCGEGETCSNCSLDCVCVEEEDDEDDDDGGGGSPGGGGVGVSTIRKIVQEEIKGTLMDILVEQTGETEEELESKGVTTVDKILNMIIKNKVIEVASDPDFLLSLKPSDKAKDYLKTIVGTKTDGDLTIERDQIYPKKAYVNDGILVLEQKIAITNNSNQKINERIIKLASFRETSKSYVYSGDTLMSQGISMDTKGNISIPVRDINTSEVREYVLNMEVVGVKEKSKEKLEGEYFDSSNNKCTLYKVTLINYSEEFDIQNAIYKWGKEISEVRVGSKTGENVNVYKEGDYFFNTNEIKIGKSQEYYVYEPGKPLAVTFNGNKSYVVFATSMAIIVALGYAIWRFNLAKKILDKYKKGRDNTSKRNNKKLKYKEKQKKNNGKVIKVKRRTHGVQRKTYKI